VALGVHVPGRFVAAGAGQAEQFCAADADRRQQLTHAHQNVAHVAHQLSAPGPAWLRLNVKDTKHIKKFQINGRNLEPKCSAALNFSTVLHLALD